MQRDTSKIISIDLSSTEVDDERQTSDLMYITREPENTLEGV